MWELCGCSEVAKSDTEKKLYMVKAEFKWSDGKKKKKVIRFGSKPFYKDSTGLGMYPNLEHKNT